MRRWSGGRVALPSPASRARTARGRGAATRAVAAVAVGVAALARAQARRRAEAHVAPKIPVGVLFFQPAQQIGSNELKKVTDVFALNSSVPRSNKFCAGAVS